MVEEKIIDKIRKLTQKADSAKELGNLEEANAFALKVTELLTKYNLSQVNIGMDKDKNKVRWNKYPEISPKKNEGLWIFDLYNTISKFNYCKVVIMNTGISKYLSILGEPHDLEVVQFLGDQIEIKIRIASRNEWRRAQHLHGIKKNAFFRHFFSGAVTGLHVNLKNQRVQQENTMAGVAGLVLVKDTKIKEFLDNNSNNIKPGKHRAPTPESIGKELGYQFGRNMEINKGVNGKVPEKYLE